MKILELCLSPSLGGLELYMFRSTQTLSGTDDVLAVLHPKGQLKSRFEKEGLSYLTEKTGVHTVPLLAAKRLAHLIDARQIDVIHMHWGKDLALAALSRWFSKTKPRLVYTRQMKMTRSKDDFYHNFLYRQMDRMLAITDTLANEASGFLSPENAKKVARLYYGVEAPDTHLDQAKRRLIRQGFGIDDETFLVGLFGRIERGKGQYLLIEALARAKKEHDNVAILIVGHAMEDSYLMELKTQVARMGLKKSVFFKGFVDQPQTWMQTCDCVVLASHEETFGLVLVEAMLAGIAVIGSRRGGVPEIIEDGKSGLLFQSGESEALYHCLIRLTENRSFCQKLAEAGRERAARLFDKKKHYLKLREHLSSALS